MQWSACAALPVIGANMKKLTRILANTFILVVTVFASAQLTVDATGPIRERRRPPTAGSGGTMGRKLPISLAIEIRDAQPSATGDSLVLFVLTNSGRDKLTVPISPHPGDLEPSNPGANYALSRLSLYITTSDRAQSHALLPGTNLYGNQAFSGTLATLAPGESLRVLVRVKLLVEPSKPGTSAPVYVAHVILSTETIKTISGRTVSDTREIGSATS